MVSIIYYEARITLTVVIGTVGLLRRVLNKCPVVSRKRHTAW
jgi:hypothetical protein